MTSKKKIEHVKFNQLFTFISIKICPCNMYVNFEVVSYLVMQVESLMTREGSLIRELNNIQ